MIERRKKESAGRSMAGTKKGTAVLALMVALMLCAGCGASGDKADFGTGGIGSSTMNMDMAGESVDASGDIGAVGSGAKIEGLDVPAGWKLITTMNLEAETRQFDEAMDQLQSKVAEMGGYMENMETYNGSRYSGAGSSRYSDMTIRIPQARLSEFLTTVSDVSNVIRRVAKVADVTLSYVDMESRRDVLRTEQSRLLEFLDKAETIEEIIALEERLSEVRYQLESMESQLRALDNKVDYATVNLSLSEVKELTPMEEPTLGERISEGFMGNLRNIKDGATELMVWLIIVSPYLLIWAMLAGVVFLVVWLGRRRRPGRKAPERGVVPPPMAGSMNAWQGEQGFPPQQGMRPSQSQGGQTGGAGQDGGEQK